jgi:hypothetical protein
MNVRRHPRTEPCEQEPLHSVLEWLERHAERFAPDDGQVRGLVAGMLSQLRAAGERDELHLAWSAHGLESDDVGPVIVLLSPQGAALAGVARRKPD